MDTLIIGTNGTVACLQAHTGQLLWKTELTTKGFFSATSQQDVSVIRRDSFIFAGCAGHLFCLDSQNGRILWHNSLEGFGHNDISLALEGVSVQYLQKVVRRN